MVVMKLIAPRIDDAPAKCSDRMAKSMAGPGVPLGESGAERAQPVPMPLDPGAPGMNSEVSSRAKDAGSSQKEMLFRRGRAMSGAPIITAPIHLPTPPIIAGMSAKNIMMRP